MFNTRQKNMLLTRLSRLRIPASTMVLGLLCGILGSPAALALGAPDVCSWKSNFIAVGSMAAPRAGHVATVLRDRSVLVTGGSTSTSTVNTSERFDPVSGRFTATQGLITTRYFHTATLLNSGKVLVAGGSLGGGTGGALASAELYDPFTNAYTPTGSLAKARVDYTATLLSDGQVLMVGGSGPFGGFVAEIELYDPASGQFTVVASLATPRAHHTATRLPQTTDGIEDILIVGGTGIAGTSTSVERLTYNTATRTFRKVTVSTAASLSVARQDHTATLLMDGSVLVTGGTGQTNQPVAAVERWFGNAFSLAGALSHPRRNHFATLLPTGQVLIAGGLDSQAIAPTELYTPGYGFKDIGNMVTPRFYAAAASLPNGQVLYVGGYDASFLNQVASTEIYDPFWAGIGPMSQGRANHSSTLLADGRVLLAGGDDGMGGARSSAELFDPATMNFARVNMLASREKHTATRLASGEVLLTGGQAGVGQFLASSEIFRPASNSFVASAALSVPRLDHTATLLADGRVLVTGGFGPGSAWQTTEFFNWNAGTAQGNFSPGPNMTRDRRAHAAALLSNGRVLLSGGWSNLVSGITYSLEEFDPASNAFSAHPNPSWMVTNREYHRMAALPGQTQAMVVGGLTSGIAPTASFETTPSGAQGQMQQARFQHALTEVGSNRGLFWVIGGQSAYTGSPLASVERLDSSNLGATLGVQELGAGRARHTATLLNDGRVLVAGGKRDMDGITAAVEISKTTYCQSLKRERRPGDVFIKKVYIRILPDSVAIRSLVGNAGRINNPGLKVRYDLVAKDGSEQRITVGELRVPKLGPGERGRLSSSFRVPLRLPKGDYAIQACLPPQSGLAGKCFDVQGSIERRGELKDVAPLQFQHVLAPKK